MTIPALQSYLNTFVVLRGSTVPETSYYAALQTLLNSVGEALRPHVRAVIHPRDTGAGLPDLALFDENQPPDQMPAHGIIEAKPIAADLLSIARGEQVRRYVAHYGQALVTNYYQFALVTRGTNGSDQSVIEEQYRMAANEAEFWAANPAQLAEVHQAPLSEYLLRVMRRSASLAAPQDVAWILASYAREAKSRIAASGVNLTTLAKIREQLEKALGVKFESAAADDFFRSTLVQTLFYGVFSAWVLWSEQHAHTDRDRDHFDLWRDTRNLNVPAIQELFEQLTAPSRLRPLAIEEVLEWTADALNRVDRTAFFQAFGRGSAVQYFYEPFLEAFDPELRRQLGVWYTPPEVVDYMVARVDAALRSELGITDGLADPNVYVLDPCCGTGAYLVSVLRRVYETLRRRDGDALAAQAAQQAMRERIYGFELLPAPFVVAHLQLGILLNDLRAPLGAEQRAAVYLTNALTGWHDAEQLQLDFPELRKEHDASQKVKQEKRVLVILGNPPYSGYAGLAIGEERDLVAPYRITKRAPAPQGQGLNDLYVRFFRMAERRIAGDLGRGIVCFISNYSWLDGLSHTGMREHLIEAFDSIYIDNLHGDRIISEYAPDGRTSETVFAMRGTSSGIRIGTAISMLVRHERNGAALPAKVFYRDMNQARADERRAALLESLETPDFNSQYQSLVSSVALGLPLKPRAVGANYLEWPRLPELFGRYYAGVTTGRDRDLVDIDRDTLFNRMKKYFDPSVSRSELERLVPSLLETVGRFNADTVHQYLLKRGFLPQNVVRYCYRPFDVRWVYWEPETKLLDERRVDYFRQIQEGNVWIEARQRQVMDKFDRGYFTNVLSDNFGNGRSSFFPLYLYDTPESHTLFDPAVHGGRKPNLTERAQTYLQTMDADAETLFYHALAVLHAPAYRIENAGALRQDWPRVPLPTNRDRLLASAALGRQVAALLDVETAVEGVTRGEPRPELATIGVLSSTTGGAPDFNVTANWGYLSGSAVMPGGGKIVEREGVIDVYLNDTTYWKGIPAAVWEYTLGGYQVLKKWLSYRTVRVLGRALRAEEAREFMHIARRIAALIGLAEALDGNYRVTPGTQVPGSRNEVH